MGFKCKLIEKDSNPMQEGSPKKWYATTQSSTALSGKAMTKAAAENTTLAPIELEAALDLLGNFIPQQLLQGHTVTLPGLGYFRLTFKSKGADTVKDFDPKELIYDVRPVFVPDKALRERIKKDIEFLDNVQVEMATARQFLFTARIKASKDKQVFDTANRVEKIISEQGFEVRRMRKADIKRFLALYFEASMNGEQMPDIDGEQFYEVDEDEEDEA